MPHGRYEVEFHLTPRGWIEGSSWYSGNIQKEVEPPQDRVLTVRKYTDQIGGWSPENVRYNVQWLKEALEKEIEELEKKYPLLGFC